MKKTSAFLAISTLGTVLAVQTLKADVVAGWTFESSGLGSSSPTFAPGAGLASTNFFAEVGAQAGTAAAFGLHATAATYSSPAGNNSTKSLSANNWSIGDYYQFQVSTLGYQNIVLSYGQNGSATGPGNFKLAYSLDGSTFTDFSTNAIPSGVTWAAATTNTATQFNDDFTAITALNNASSVYFRIIDISPTAINGGTVGTGGTDRIDNFMVNGDTIAAVPEPTTVTLAVLGGFGCLLAMRRRK